MNQNPRSLAWSPPQLSPQLPSQLPHSPRRAVAVAISAIAAAAVLQGCAGPGVKTDPAQAIRAEMAQATTPKPAVVVPPQISDALQATEPAAASALPAETRFDLIVNNAMAREVFMAMVTDTRYSMLMHPDVTGTLSVSLRGVTIREALEAIRDVYGYDFKIDGRRITVYPPTLQTRIYTVNYLNAQRNGKSEVRVSSGQQVQTPAGNGQGQQTQQNNQGTNNGTPNGQQAVAMDSSRVSTTTKTDFWAEITDALKGIVGSAAGRNVVVSPQSGVIAVRAMPDELRQIEGFLKAMRISVERQVMLEAKIVEVQLRDGFQSGIDWSILRGRGAGGVTNGLTSNNLVVPKSGSTLPTLPTTLTPSLPDVAGYPNSANGVFGLVFKTSGFEGVLSFLETQGDTQILSSPRVATMNNQQAVLKVGSDDYFVTSITGGTITLGAAATGSTTTLPTVNLTSYFSGIALDVTPQIDQGDTITLHVHPSITTVSEVTKSIDLGQIGTYRLPVPSSASNETDTVVRVTDGNIVAIGGLMQLAAQGSKSGLPGSTNVPLISNLLGNQQKTTSKRELVVLIKPTIIRTNEDWADRARDSRDRVDELDAGRRVITVGGQR